MPGFIDSYLFFFKQKTAYDVRTCLEFRRVLFRSRLSDHLHLGDESSEPRVSDLEVDVGRPRGVRHGADGAEPVGARRVRLRLTVALEVRIARPGTAVLGGEVAPEVVGLPDLDESVDG